jgi:putative lysine/arginine/ornithine/histidine/octopine transport system permease protein
VGPALPTITAEDGDLGEIVGWGQSLLLATTVTLRVALGALALGPLWGLLGATAKLSPVRALRWLADAYTTINRGVPELLIILIAYYGGTITLTRLLRLIDPQTQYVEIPAMAAGIFSLSLVFGAYATEAFRGAILAIPTGQIEAAMAVGMSPWLIFRRIKLPQMWRFALPGLGNNWISLVKDTSLVSTVGLDDLMRVSKLAANVTHQHFQFLSCAALIYLSLTVVNTAALARLERRANRGVRRD